MLVPSLQMKSRVMLAPDVIYTYATHAGRVQDVTDTDCQTQNKIAALKAMFPNSKH